MRRIHIPHLLFSAVMISGGEVFAQDNKDTKDKNCTPAELQGTTDSALDQEFNAATSALNGGDWRTAIEKLTALDKGKYHCAPPVVQNLGKALEKGKHYVEALDTYRRLKPLEEALQKGELKRLKKFEDAVRDALDAAGKLEKEIPKGTFTVSGPDATHAVVKLKGKTVYGEDVVERPVVLNTANLLDPGNYSYRFDVVLPPVESVCFARTASDMPLDLKDQKPVDLSTLDLEIAPWSGFDKDPAKESFDKGREEARKGKWEEASKLFGSKELSGNTAAVFNRAFAELRQGNHYAAFKALAKMPKTHVAKALEQDNASSQLSEAKGKPEGNAGDGNLQQRAQDYRNAIKTKLLHTLRMTFAQGSIDLRVKLDQKKEDAPLEKLPTEGELPEYIVGQEASPALRKGAVIDIVLEPNHKYSFTAARATDYEPVQFKLEPAEVGPGGITTRMLSLDPNPPPPDYGFRAGIALVAIGAVVSSASAVVLGLWNEHRKEIISDPLQCPGRCYPEALRDLDVIDKRFGPQRWVPLLAGGAVVAGFGAGFLSWRHPDKAKTPAASTHSTWVVEPAITVGPRGVFIGGRFF